MRDENNFGLQALLSSSDPHFKRSYETADPTQPLSLEAKMCNRKCNGFSRFRITITGARHPYDPARTLDRTDDVGKNPALVPVLKLLRDRLPKIIERCLSASGFEVLGSRLKPVESGEGLSFTVDFPQSLSRFRQIRIVGKMAVAVDGIKAEIHWVIEANKARQPKPDTAAAMIYRAQLDAERNLKLIQASLGLNSNDADTDADKRRDAAA